VIVGRIRASIEDLSGITNAFAAADPADMSTARLRSPLVAR